MKESIIIEKGKELKGYSKYFHILSILVIIWFTGETSSKTTVKYRVWQDVKVETGQESDKRVEISEEDDNKGVVYPENYADKPKRQYSRKLEQKRYPKSKSGKSALKKKGKSKKFRRYEKKSKENPVSRLERVAKIMELKRILQKINPDLLKKKEEPDEGKNPSLREKVSNTAIVALMVVGGIILANLGATTESFPISGNTPLMAAMGLLLPTGIDNRTPEETESSKPQAKNSSMPAACCLQWESQEMEFSTKLEAPVAQNIEIDGHQSALETLISGGVEAEIFEQIRLFDIQAGREFVAVGSWEKQTAMEPEITVPIEAAIPKNIEIGWAQTTIVEISEETKTPIFENIGGSEQHTDIEMSVPLDHREAVARTLEVEGELSKSNEENLMAENGLFRDRHKISIREQIVLYEKLCEQPKIASKKLRRATGIKISISQLNRIRKEWGFPGRKGRPHKIETEIPVASVISTEQKQAGLKLFSIWLDENSKHEQVISTIQQSIEFYKDRHPDEDFRLLKSGRQTIEMKWKALLLLPFLDIGRLSELAYKEHNLEGILGRSYSYSTLTQFLGELERIDAGYFLKFELIKWTGGKYCYIDAHMIAYWTRQKMHKGMITTKGKIMPGSKLVVAHDQNANAIDFEYHPPDTHLSKIMENFCGAIVELTGMRVFIIDREVNSVDTANLFNDNEWELLCMLCSNEYKGPQDFKKHFSKRLDDDTVLYKATWKVPRADDPRKFILVQSQNKLIVYWGTPKIVDQLTAEQFISVYRARTDIQENSFKDMKSSLALDINYGRRTFSGPDRTQQRELEELDTKIQNQNNRVITLERKILEQLKKVEISLDKRHGVLLKKRRNKLNQLLKTVDAAISKMTELEKQKEQIGPPRQRKDRDFRKQSIMTFRTLWLNNQLKSFKSLLSESLPKSIDVNTFIELFFNRSATVVETPSNICYIFDSSGLIPEYRDVLARIIDGFNRISLTSGGKPVSAQLVGFR